MEKQLAIVGVPHVVTAIVKSSHLPRLYMVNSFTDLMDNALGLIADAETYRKYS
jgi:hypothetical protein